SGASSRGDVHAELDEDPVGGERRVVQDHEQTMGSARRPGSEPSGVLAYARRKERQMVDGPRHEPFGDIENFSRARSPFSEDLSRRAARRAEHGQDMDGRGLLTP